ncbi:hypothetical protein L3Y34_008159 [Caenorhabditis briggsae]|uniref:Transthyretin-like family protein n=1 Tax=Caenorhabditis briggsae TaxID=6238 RepID=A0AAE9D152_CAEBR|nr:hypothetical protein L3Y34_008159 [Caenorhabditis briggsae]
MLFKMNSQFVISLGCFFALLVPAGGLFNFIGTDQYVVVTGRFFCEGMPASDVLVKLYEDGTIYDTKLDSTRTYPDGTFRVAGQYTKIFDMDPKINIYHSCNHYGVRFALSAKSTEHFPALRQEDHY